MSGYTVTYYRIDPFPSSNTTVISNSYYSHALNGEGYRYFVQIDSTNACPVYSDTVTQSITPEINSVDLTLDKSIYCHKDSIHLTAIVNPDDGRPYQYLFYTSSGDTLYTGPNNTTLDIADSVMGYHDYRYRVRASIGSCSDLSSNVSASDGVDAKNQNSVLSSDDSDNVVCENSDVVTFLEI